MRWPSATTHLSHNDARCAPLTLMLGALWKVEADDPTETAVAAPFRA